MTTIIAIGYKSRIIIAVDSQRNKRQFPTGIVIERSVGHQKIFPLSNLPVVIVESRMEMTDIGFSKQGSCMHVDDIEEYRVQMKTGGNLADSLTETFMQGKVTISFDPETNELLLGRGPKLREEEEG